MLDQQLVRMFEPLGMDCEFASFQRRFGHKPPGLMQWVTINLADLVRGLHAGFDGIGSPKNLEIRWQGQEYICFEKAYGISYHAFEYSRDTPADTLLQKEARRLPFLKSILMHNLRTSKKIFVCKHRDALSERQILDLHSAICVHGPNILLSVEIIDSANPSAELERLKPGLFLCRAPRAPDRTTTFPDLDAAIWLDICGRIWSRITETNRSALIAAAG